MHIEFASNKLEKKLSEPRLIKKYYGKQADKLINRMSELKAADCLNDIPHVPPPRRHKLEGDLDGYWGVDYSRNYRIILKPIGNFNINDVTTIKEIRIIKLEDYH